MLYWRWWKSTQERSTCRPHQRDLFYSLHLLIQSVLELRATKSRWPGNHTIATLAQNFNSWQCSFSAPFIDFSPAQLNCDWPVFFDSKKLRYNFGFLVESPHWKQEWKTMGDNASSTPAPWFEWRLRKTGRSTFWQPAAYYFTRITFLLLLQAQCLCVWDKSGLHRNGAR